MGLCHAVHRLGGSGRYHNSSPSLIPVILKRHPRLRLICAHFSGYSEWDDAVKYLHDTDVYINTSSSLSAVPRERFAELIRQFGEDTVMFGTDFPMWDAEPEIDALLSLGLSDSALQKIFSGNLIRRLGVLINPGFRLRALRGPEQ